MDHVRKPQLKTLSTAILYALRPAQCLSALEHGRRGNTPSMISGFRSSGPGMERVFYKLVSWVNIFSVERLEIQSGRMQPRRASLDRIQGRNQFCVPGNRCDTVRPVRGQGFRSRPPERELTGCSPDRGISGGLPVKRGGRFLPRFSCHPDAARSPGFRDVRSGCTRFVNRGPFSGIEIFDKVIGGRIRKGGKEAVHG